MPTDLLSRLPLSSPPRGPRPLPAPAELQAPEVAGFFATLGGASLGDGAYRVHAPDDVQHWTAVAVAAFPRMQGRVWCFASDWMGRQFALIDEPGRRHDVILIEQYSGEVFHTDRDFTAFHDELLVEDPESALNLALYARWRAAGGRIPEPHECVELRVPLFLGGEEDLTNLALTDMEVHWAITAQLLSQARGLAPGTRIEGVDLR